MTSLNLKMAPSNQSVFSANGIVARTGYMITSDYVLTTQFQFDDHYRVTSTGSNTMIRKEFLNTALLLPCFVVLWTGHGQLKKDRIMQPITNVCHGRNLSRKNGP
mmetsp:Transcript_15992/g.23755  ORF Transcript_15992/g.23755 Transcript_15992/m.23755 type:complete len:105 (-) Transcript_15992:724-1038(-)